MVAADQMGQGDTGQGSTALLQMLPRGQLKRQEKPPTKGWWHFLELTGFSLSKINANVDLNNQETLMQKVVGVADAASVLFGQGSYGHVSALEIMLVFNSKFNMEHII